METAKSEDADSNDETAATYRVHRYLNFHNADGSTKQVVQKIDYNSNGEVVGNKNSHFQTFDQYDFTLPKDCMATVKYSYLPGTVTLVPNIPTNIWAYNLQNQPVASKYNDLTVDVNFQIHAAKKVTRTIYVTDENGNQITRQIGEVDFNAQNQVIGNNDELPMFDTKTITVPAGYVLKFTGVLVNHDSEYAPYYTDGTIAAYKPAASDYSEGFYFQIVKADQANVTLWDDTTDSPITWNDPNYNAETGVWQLTAEPGQLASQIPPVFAGYQLKDANDLDKITNGSTVTLHFAKLGDIIIDYVDQKTNKSILQLHLDSSTATPEFTDQYGHHEASKDLVRALDFPGYKLVAGQTIDRIVHVSEQPQTITFYYEMTDPEAVANTGSFDDTTTPIFNHEEGTGNYADLNNNLEQMRQDYEPRGYDYFGRQQYHDTNEPTNYYDQYNSLSLWVWNQPVTVHFVDQNGRSLHDNVTLATNPNAPHGQADFSNRWAPWGKWEADPIVIAGYHLVATHGVRRGSQLLPQLLNHMLVKQ